MSTRSKLRWIGLQFFAEEPPADPPADPPQDPPADPPKAFTQEELTRMLAREKQQGRSSIIKAPGYNPEEKGVVESIKKILDSQKTQEQLNQEALTNEKQARTEAEGKAVAAERKLAVVLSGCKTEFVDEVMALSLVKVSDTVDFDAALKAVKEKCPTFFTDDDDGGTGSGQGHKRTPRNDKSGSLGSRLAQSATSDNSKKNPYFSN